MRVTKNIREYIEREIKNKYEKANKELWSDYDTRRNAIINEIKARLRDVDRELVAYLQTQDMYDASRGTDIISFNTYGIYTAVNNPNEFNDIQDKSRKLREKRDRAIWDIVMSLELGEAGKDDLQALVRDVDFSE